MKADRFVIRQKLLIALASFSSASARDWSCRAASAQAKPLSRTWPGIATRLGAEAVGSAGIVGSVKKWIYRVDCGELYYDLQGSGNPSLAVGQDVTFRIEKQKAYLDDGKNGKRYNTVGTASPIRSRVPSQTRNTRETHKIPRALSA